MEPDDTGCVSAQCQLSAGNNAGIRSYHHHAHRWRAHWSQPYHCEVLALSQLAMWGGKKEWGVQGKGISKILHVLPIWGAYWMAKPQTFIPLWCCYISFLSPSPLPPSSTNLTELSKAVCLLAAVCQEVSYWDQQEPLQLQLLWCWRLLNQKTLSCCN